MTGLLSKRDDGGARVMESEGAFETLQEERATAPVSGLHVEGKKDSRVTARPGL